MSSDPSAPTVPNVDGVPPLASTANVTDGQATPATSDGITVSAKKWRWGIYKSGTTTLAVEPDSFVSVAYSAEYRISDFPLQGGGFQTYNKVALPFDTMVTMSKGGTNEDRTDFIRAIEALRGDTNLYDVVTPEFTYLNVNFAHVSLQRAREQGGGLVTYELALREIRSEVANTVTPTKAPSGEAKTSNGTTQAQDAPESTKQALDSKSMASVANGKPKDPFYSLKSSKIVKTIKTVAGKASQVINTPVGNAVATFALSQKGGSLFADVALAGNTVAAGVAILDGVPIINNAYSGFPGDVAIVDTQGSTKPNYTGLGSRYQLVWVQ